MSATAPRKVATYQDLLGVSDHLVAEILDGDLFASPRPAFRHAYASSILGADVTNRFQGSSGGGDRPGGWWILDKPELHLQDDVVVPDIAGWRCERVPVPPDAPWFDLAPDWACEIISPSTETFDRGDRGRKLRIYAREQVGHLWLVNPIAKTLEVYRLSESAWTLLHTFVDNDVVQAEPFSTVSFDISRWWLPEAPEE